MPSEDLCWGSRAIYFWSPVSDAVCGLAGNHPSLSYGGGQVPIVHLEADLHTVVAWADSQRVPWAFALGNAAESRAEFRCRLTDLSEVNWTAVAADQWNGDLKGPKQAEFLVHRSPPGSLIERIGVINKWVARRVCEIVGGTARVRVEVRRQWLLLDMEPEG